MLYFLEGTVYKKKETRWMVLDFICFRARPEYEASTFTLLMTFPNKELTDDKASLKDANLLNAVIVQRIK